MRIKATHPFVTALGPDLFVSARGDDWIALGEFKQHLKAFLEAVSFIENVLLLEPLPVSLLSPAHASAEDRESHLKVYSTLLDTLFEMTLEYPNVQLIRADTVHAKLVEIMPNACRHQYG